MKYLALSTVLVLSSICSMAQNYIKFVGPTEINGQKFLKGEIYQQISDKRILFGKDTIDLGKTIIEKSTVVDISQISDKLNFVTNLDNINYQINVEKFINNKDTIKLIKADKSIIPFFTKGNASVNINECGSTFRLIIPNLPTIVYYENEIPKPQIQESINTTENEVVENEGFISGLSWWQYIMGSILLLVIIFFLYKIIRRFFKKSGQYPLYEKYTGGDFNDFAERMNISRKKLFKYNNDKLFNYESMSYKEKEKLKNSLRNKDFIIGYSDVYSEPSKVSEFEKINQNSQTTIESYQQVQNTSELSSQIQRMESRILNKIDSLTSNKEASQKIENQQKEIETLKIKINQQNKDIERSNQENIVLNNELTQVYKNKQEIENEFSKYSEKVIFVEYLEPFARGAYDYYNYCQTGYNKALEYLSKLTHSDSELISIISQLLVKYNSSIPEKTTHWIGVINEIKDSKATANIDMIRSLKQIPNNEEKSKEFKRILLKEVFEKYSSSIFILTEEFCNLSKFTNDSTSVVKDFEKFFTSFKSELHSKSKTIGLELNYVPLFEHYEKYAAFTKLANQACSLPYKNIKNITKDSVLEIINYGFGNEETNVILA